MATSTADPPQVEQRFRITGAERNSLIRMALVVIEGETDAVGLGVDPARGQQDPKVITGCKNVAAMVRLLDQIGWDAADNLPGCEIRDDLLFPVEQLRVWVDTRFHPTALGSAEDAEKGKREDVAECAADLAAMSGLSTRLAARREGHHSVSALCRLRDDDPVAAAEAAALMGDRTLTVDNDRPLRVEGSADELHRMVLNLLDSAEADKPPVPVEPYGLGNSPVIRLPEEIADFLAAQIANEASGEMQGEVEFQPPLSTEKFCRLAEIMERERKVIERLVKKRELELTALFMEFAGKTLGRWEAFELDGWSNDDNEWAPFRRLARQAWQILTTEASELIAKKQAEFAAEAAEAGEVKD